MKFIKKIGVFEKMSILKDKESLITQIISSVLLIVLGILSMITIGLITGMQGATDQYSSVLACMGFIFLLFIILNMKI